MSKFLKSVLSAAVVVSTLASPAAAGGLFGHGGIIRGDVGNFLDKHVEKPITTPLARATVVVVGSAVGAYVGGEVGAVVGAAVGHAINEAAGPGKGKGKSRQRKVVEAGKTCSTDTVGKWELKAPSPLGSECTIKFDNGAEVNGTVTT